MDNIPESLKLTLDCRIPKIHRLVEILNSKIINAEGHEDARNAAIYIPARQDRDRIMKWITYILQLFLGLENLTEEATLKKYVESMQGKATPPDQKYRGRIFMLPHYVNEQL